MNYNCREQEKYSWHDGRFCGAVLCACGCGEILDGICACGCEYDDTFCDEAKYSQVGEKD